MDLYELEHIASSCKQCDLYKGRINPVFAKGNEKAKIMICGMVPAGDENKAGIPFVGRAGKLLDTILIDAGLTLDDVYITNLVKCYLAAGLPLKQDWIDGCISYLITQIGIIRPYIIITLGKDSSVNLLGMENTTSLGSIRGKLFNYSNEITIIPTYHPSFLLRKGGIKSKYYQTVLDDFQKAIDQKLVGEYGIIPF